MYTQYLGHTKATFNLMYMYLLATMDELKHKFAPVIISIATGSYQTGGAKKEKVAQ